jgi:hypothetical protein
MRPFNLTLSADGPDRLILGGAVFEIGRDRVETVLAKARSFKRMEPPALDEELAHFATTLKEEQQ